MRRVLFSWHGVHVHSYPAFLYVGLLCGVYAGYGAATSMPIDPDRATAGILILIVPRLLNYIVAIYLIIIGLLGLFGPLRL